MVGVSPFLALNDYLSFKKIETLDYTFPEGFDPDAQDLVQRLLVSGWSSYTLCRFGEGLSPLTGS